MTPKYEALRAAAEKYELIAVKRKLVPEWLYKLYSYIPAWVQPFRWALNKKVKS